MAADPSQERMRLVRLLAGGSAAIILLMLLVGNVNLVVRWVTGRQVAGASELILVLLPMSVFAALPRAEQEGVNVKSGALVDRLPPRAARIVIGAGVMVSVVMTALLVWATASRAVASTRQGEVLIGVRNLPVWPSRLVVAAGLLILLLVLLRQGWVLVRTGQDPTPSQGAAL